LAPPSKVVTARQLQRLIDTVGVLQIDSVNVLSRSHYLPVFARLGAYPHALLDVAGQRQPRRLVEYWAHEASLISPTTHRLLRWRMARAREEAWDGMRSVAAEAPGVIEAVLACVRERGAMTSAAIEAEVAPRQGARAKTHWGWNWSSVKKAIEYSFWAGDLSSAGRTPQFERRYDLPERVLPAAVTGAPDPTPSQAWRDLVEIGARAMGVADEPALRDYFRLKPQASRPAIDELVAEGTLLPVQVEGWRRPGYLHRDAALPRRVAGSALLSPFDSLIWFRDRTEQLFDFRYRIEIYTPAEQRVHGYYVLPYLVGDRLVARVDLKADRSAGRLLVQSAWREPQPNLGFQDEDHVAKHLALDLVAMAGWQGLSDVEVVGRGDLTPALRRALDAL
jgi:uncharacterized protein